MAHHASAKKRIRQDRKRYARNRHQRATVRNALRKARAAADAGAEDAPQLAAHAERVMRKACSKGVYPSRTVSRTVSRLTRAVARASS